MIDKNRGGLWDTSHTGALNWAIFYVQVEDVPAAIDRAQTSAPPSSSRSSTPAPSNSRTSQIR